MTKKEISLALSGGGAKGAAHIGVLDYLDQQKIKIKEIAGSSAGALVGALYAYGTLQAFADETFNMPHTKLIRYFDITLDPSGIVKGTAVLKMLERFLPHNITFKDLNIPLTIVATDFETGKTIELSKGSVLNAVRASISIPGVFTPHKSNTRTLVDGDVSNPLPISCLKNKKNIVAVNLHSKNLYTPKNKSKKPNIVDVLMQSVNIFEHHQAQNIIKLHPPKILIEPNVKDINPLNFPRALDAYKKGYRAAKQKHKEISLL